VLSVLISNACRVEGSLTRLLVRQDPVGDEYQVETVEGRDSRIDDRSVPVVIEHIERLHLDSGCAADSQVVGNDRESVRIAGDEEQGVSRFGKAPGGCLRDGGGRPDNQCLSHDWGMVSFQIGQCITRRG